MARNWADTQRPQWRATLEFEELLRRHSKSLDHYLYLYTTSLSGDRQCYNVVCSKRVQVLYVTYDSEYCDVEKFRTERQMKCMLYGVHTKAVPDITTPTPARARCSSTVENRFVARQIAGQAEACDQLG